MGRTLDDGSNLPGIDCSLEELEGMFGTLPIHKLCYSRATYGGLLVEVAQHKATVDNMKQDCLGMTPLHVLACLPLE